MPGTRAGAAKAKITNLERHGAGFYGEIGAIGGRVTGVKKGFAADPERARLAGIKGGTISRRGKKVPSAKTKAGITYEKKGREVKISINNVSIPQPVEVKIAENLPLSEVKQRRKVFSWRRSQS